MGLIATKAALNADANAKQATTVALIERHSAIRQSLRAILEAEPDIEVIGEATASHDMATLVKQSDPQTLVIEAALLTAEMNALLNGIVEREAFPRIIALGSGVDREQVAHALRNGACAYLKIENAGEELPTAVRVATPEEPFFGQGVGRETGAQPLRGKAQPATVLVVDDDPDFVEAARIVLEKGGHRVIAAANREEGLQLLRSAKPDLVVLDVMMPEGTEGFHFVWELRKEADESIRNTPVLMVTAINQRAPLKIDPNASDGDFKPREYLPVEDFIEKPVGLDEFVSKVEALLEQRAL